MPFSRKKSCITCQAAKARCSRNSPCTRCTSKQIHCSYDFGLIHGHASSKRNELPQLAPKSHQRKRAEPISSTVGPYVGPTASMLPELDPFTAFMNSNTNSASKIAQLQSQPPFTSIFSPVEPTESFLTQNMLAGQLLSYPGKLLTQQLPPFIYPECCKGTEDYECMCGGTNGHHCLPTPLANCRAIVAMVETTTISNYDFIWTTICNEADRLRKEACMY